MVHGALEPADRERRELEPSRVADQASVRLEADAQAVLGEQPGGIGVVGEDRRLGILVVVRGVSGRPRAIGAAGESGPGEELANPPGQLGGGLRRESQAEHLVGGHLAGTDQPDDPSGHDGGLAGAGSGNDQTRLHRGSDRGQLLVAEGQPHDSRQVSGALRWAGHRSRQHRPGPDLGGAHRGELATPALVADHRGEGLGTNRLRCT